MAKFRVITSRGEPVDLEAETVTEDKSQSMVTFSNGSDVVASFRGFDSFYPL